MRCTPFGTPPAPSASCREHGDRTGHPEEGRYEEATRPSEGTYAGYGELVSMKAASGRDEDMRDIGALGAAGREA
jgi:hypothetical protein